MNYELSYYVIKHKKSIILWSLASLIIIGAVIGIVLYDQQQSRKDKVSVDVLTAPQDAKILLSNGITLDQGTNWVIPGDYTATISKTGFTARTQHITIASYNKPSIYIGLAPEDNDAKQWAQKHGSLYQELETRSRDTAISVGRDIAERNPIITKLPIEDPYFSVRYINKNDRDITLIIRGTSPRYREYAIKKIYDLGYDPTEYDVEIKGFVNPLGGEDK